MSCEVKGSAEKGLSERHAALLAWFDEQKRALPWREGHPDGLFSPWGVWVSEVMLQQTRVASVLDYFPRFMERFPTPQALAEAPWEALASQWAGLGYYQRARRLQAAAQEVCERHGGEVPDDPETFGALTGVGPYTRGAVMSIAFGRVEPIVDGNVTRVMCRLYGEGRDARSPVVQRALWAWARAWVEAGDRPGDLNQALMELGATCCTPKRPSCERCPLSEGCEANAQGRAVELPHLPKKNKALPEEVYLAALCREAERGGAQAGGGVWVVRSGEQGLLGGLWGFPLTRWEGDEGALKAALKVSELTTKSAHSAQGSLFEPELITETPTLTEERRALKNARGLAEVGRLLTCVEHRFTHKKWRLYLFEGSLECSHHEKAPLLLKGEEEARLVSEAELSALGVGGPSLKAGRAAGLALKARRGAGRS